MMHLYTLYESLFILNIVKITIQKNLVLHLRLGILLATEFNKTSDLCFSFLAEQKSSLNTNPPPS